MINEHHLIGLLLGAEEDWPQAFEAVLGMVGPITVGRGALIGANAVVSHDVPEEAVVRAPRATVTAGEPGEPSEPGDEA